MFYACPVGLIVASFKPNGRTKLGIWHLIGRTTKFYRYLTTWTPIGCDWVVTLVLVVEVKAGIAIVHEIWSTWEIFRNNSFSRPSEFPATFKYTKKKLNSWQFPVDIPLEKNTMEEQSPSPTAGGALWQLQVTMPPDLPAKVFQCRGTETFFAPEVWSLE